jgi:hypothetical protein
MTATEKFGVREIIEHIDSFGRNLTKWEVDFIGKLIDNPRIPVTSPMEEIVNRIYDEKC